MYVGTFDDGLYATDDGGETWRAAWDGVADRRVLAVSVSPSHRVGGVSVLYAGTEPSNLYRSEDGGMTWSWRRLDAGLDRQYAWASAVDPADPDLWYASVSRSPFAAHDDGDDQSRLLRSRGNGWSAIDLWGDDAELRRMPYALATLPAQPGRLLVGLRGGTMLLGEDAGEAWSRRIVTAIKNCGHSMLHGKSGDLCAAAIKERVRTEDEDAAGLSGEVRKRPFNFALGAGAHDLDVDSHCGGSSLNVFGEGLGQHRVGWIDEREIANSLRYQLADQTKLFCCDLSIQRRDPGDIAAWPVETGNKAKRDGVSTNSKDNGYTRGRGLGHNRRQRAARCGNHCDPPTYEIARQFLQLIIPAGRPAELNRDVLAFNKPRLVQTFAIGS